MDRDEIKAVHEGDLLGLLESLGERIQLENGERKCVYCQRVITIDNLEAIIPVGQSIAFSCNQPSCITALMMEE